MSCSIDRPENAHCLVEVSPMALTRPRAGKRSGGVLQTLYLWSERSRQRSELRELAKSGELLKDVGLSFYDVHIEGQKPFWKE